MFSKQRKIAVVLVILCLALIGRGLGLISFSLSLSNPLTFIAFVILLVVLGWIISSNDIRWED